MAMPLKHRTLLIILFLASIIANYAIPYSALLGVRSLCGAFLFWISISLFVAALVIAASSGWRD